MLKMSTIRKVNNENYLAACKLLFLSDILENPLEHIPQKSNFFSVCRVLFYILIMGKSFGLLSQTLEPFLLYAYKHDILNSHYEKTFQSMYHKQRSLILNVQDGAF